jgi:hypothetical protein
VIGQVTGGGAAEQGVIRGFSAAAKRKPRGLKPRGEIRQSRKGNGLACGKIRSAGFGMQILLAR